MDDTAEHKRLVEQGYDRMAEQYLAWRAAAFDGVQLSALEDLARRLPPGARVLDLGCGAGLPITKWLAERFKVVGVDISTRQLELARKNVPNATFIKGDIAERDIRAGGVDFPAGKFDAVTAFYSIIHVPRDLQPALLERILRWLKPGGYFLATWAMTEWEGEEEDWEGWGATMWWSHYGRDENLAMLERAGFGVVWAEPKTTSGETWLWALACKEPRDLQEAE